MCRKMTSQLAKVAAFIPAMESHPGSLSGPLQATRATSKLPKAHVVATVSMVVLWEASRVGSNLASTDFSMMTAAKGGNFTVGALLRSIGSTQSFIPDRSRSTRMVAVPSQPDTRLSPGRNPASQETDS
ncbi:hypothetical protein B0O80DRAFT_448225 [Mortierella sp. GBAus27b]|nr:hypothetical protein B0O80DRAFT_448225 [Mortierella sp. GBAus27b]